MEARPSRGPRIRISRDEALHTHSGNFFPAADGAMNRSVMIIAGEASGEQYGARVISALKQLEPGLEFFGVGGDRMRAEGMELLFHTSQSSIMGFVEVVQHFPLIRKMFAVCERELAARRPGALLLIDYPGFNLRFARRAKRSGIPVVYYICPQVWAWGRNRAASMKALVDQLAVVFPFEVDIFTPLNIPTTFVGHPLLEILPDVPRAEFLAAHALRDERILALLPGSRLQEIRRMLPVMLDAGRRIRQETHCTLVIGASSLPDEAYRQHIGDDPSIRLIRNASHNLMQHAYAAMVTSGTATVETACYQTPMTIVYRSSWLNYQIGKRLVNVPYIGMANILAGELVVPELIQNDLTPESLCASTLRYFTDARHYAVTRERLAGVREKMGSPGASLKVAALLQSQMQNHPQASTD
jgi:lipid-A-disaccharide synthase